MCCCSCVSIKSCTEDIDDLHVEVKVAADSRKKASSLNLVLWKS